jgi:hypothetical protein
MTSHLSVMMLYAAAVSIVFGALLRDDRRGQRRLAARIFLALVGGGYLLGWIMYVAFA